MAVVTATGSSIPPGQLMSPRRHGACSSDWTRRCLSMLLVGIVRSTHSFLRYFEHQSSHHTWPRRANRGLRQHPLVVARPTSAGYKHTLSAFQVEVYICLLSALVNIAEHGRHLPQRLLSYLSPVNDTPQTSGSAAQSLSHCPTRCHRDDWLDDPTQHNSTPAPPAPSAFRPHD
ncbi:unnamed protein product [Protopolystoma xenopodis]|uniref:Uncharacterized protein n=1 Tax=Protopolystoma xenopodis TaxID=117903 RepID=A0A3S5BYH2_9PLAT|nr:unnamed protein product [Protopolystoma xenopodis]